MTTKTKILIGILVIGIVLIGGWLVWSPQIYAEAQEVTITTDKTEYEQGEAIIYAVKNMSDHPIWFPPYLVIEKKLDDEQVRGYSTLPCLGPGSVREAPQPIKIESGGEYNSSWNQIFCDNRVSKNVTAPLGIYRIRFLYSDEWSIEYPKSAYSNEFKIKEKAVQEVIVTTDKTEYKQVETIKITLKNNLKESIFSHIGSGTPGFCIEYIERKAPAGDWEKLFAQCQYPHCIYDIDAPAEIKRGQSEIFEWKPLIYINGTSESVQAGSGIYRLVILYQIRKGSSSESWEWKTTKSNEFTIK